MEFILMKLVGQGIRPGSIFGILDKDNPGQLPPAPGGYWSDHGAMTEENFPFAAEAKQAIAKSGYFLVAPMLSRRSAVRLSPEGLRHALRAPGYRFSGLPRSRPRRGGPRKDPRRSYRIRRS
jgi:hypothetical protein